MASKTTVAVDQKLRKKIKKLSALMDIPQSAVIEKAIASLEKEMINNKNPNKTFPQNDNIDVFKILEDATQKIWKKYPEREKNQKILQKGSQTIDNFLLYDWNTGLED
ncbi:ribbon-helix-helix domain-containing protein [Candidatus Harpocratesius sp.]